MRSQLSHIIDTTSTFFFWFDIGTSLLSDLLGISFPMSPSFSKKTWYNDCKCVISDEKLVLKSFFSLHAKSKEFVNNRVSYSHILIFVLFCSYCHGTFQWVDEWISETTIMVKKRKKTGTSYEKC